MFKKGNKGLMQTIFTLNLTAVLYNKIQKTKSID